jgi:hypothetical protein
MFSKVSLIAGVVVMVVAGTVGYSIGRMRGNQTDSKSVAEVSQSFIKTLSKGEVDETYEYISETFQARNGKSHIEGIAKNIKTDNPNIVDEEVFIGRGPSENDAIYLSTVTNLPEKNNSTKGSFIIRLVNESGSWKVDSAQIY